MSLCMSALLFFLFCFFFMLETFLHLQTVFCDIKALTCETLMC